MPAIKIHHNVWEDSMGGSQRSWPIDRRTILKTSAAIAAVQITSPFIIQARGETPVRIGMVDPLTGVYAAIAQGEVVGAKFAAEEINKKGGILGRPVELLVEDSANDVGTGVQKTRKLIERDQVSFIIGDVNSGIAIAMAQVTSEKKVLHIVSGGHTDPITGANCSWNVFRVCNSTSMDANAIASTLMEKFGKKWYFLTPDYAYGHSVQAGFEKLLKAAGGTSAGVARSHRYAGLFGVSDPGKSLRPPGAHQRHGRWRPGLKPEAVRSIRSGQADGGRRHLVRA